MSDTAIGLTDELRGILIGLVEGLFPLADWIEAKVKANGYKPPDADLPWRAKNQSLTPQAMGVIPFFEELLTESERDKALVARWQEVERDPIASSPIPKLRQWRTARACLGPATFGIAASDNIFVDANKKATWRGAFYAPYWAPLEQAKAAANPQSRQDWQTFAAQLFAGTSPHWPAGQPRSDVFVRQFARDMVHAMLGMRNPAPDPWRLAMLIELGERRRHGNAFTPDDVARMLEAFQRKLPS